jgi:ribonuclease HII
MSVYEQLKNFDGGYAGMVAGVDEAGRGPWAGPVVAAAVILDRDLAATLTAVNDSKKLTEKKREELFDVVINACKSYSIAEISNTVIDRTNILSATMEAMKNAVNGLKTAPDIVLVDGNSKPDGGGARIVTVVDGDAKSLSIAAASILAKVYRDRLMRNFDRMYPGYGFARHKGYGTQEHMKALSDQGICAIHRVSYKPVKLHINQK